jgi:hypothetical protein
MTQMEFIFWLRGYLSAGSVEAESLNKTQIALIKKYLHSVEGIPDKPLDTAIAGQEKEYEEEIELYQTYGGD